MRWLRNVVAALAGYAAHPDPRAVLANTIALVIVSNQPFYPLYIYGAVSPVVAPAFLTFLSTPFFAAVPMVMRRSPLAGRCLMLAAGIGNTVLCRHAFGPGSGVEAFLFPCLILALLLFRRSERIFALAFAALVYLAYLLPALSLGAPPHLYLPDEYAALQRLNFLSALSLTALIGWLAGPGSNPNSRIDKSSEAGRP